MTRLVRWACPTTHPAVLAPSRPRKDDVRRFCLECSKATGRLVARVPSALVKERERRIERQRHKKARTAVRTEEQTTAYYTVAGVNLLEEMRRMIQAKAFIGTSLRRPCNKPPTLVVRRASRKPYTRLGTAYWSRWMIRITDYPGVTEHDVKETLCHELAHLATPGTVHGPRWRTMFRLASEELLGVRPRLEKRFHGEVTGLLKAREAAESAEP